MCKLSILFAASASAKVLFVAPPSPLRRPSSAVAAASGSGTRADPLTSVQACLDALSAPGDECRLQAGRYPVPTAAAAAADGKAGSGGFGVHGKVGTAAAPIVIGGAGDGEVVLDGTVAVGGWAPTTLPSGRRAFRATVGGGGDQVAPVPWQLFDAATRELQVPARWPNAFFHDRSVFQGPERWAHSANGTHDVASGAGVLVDAGPCASPADCCNRCNGNGLAASGINATGAIAVMNLWSCDTGVQRIASHAPGSGALHYNATWPCHCDKYRDGRGRYYLEGKLTFLDAPTEWWVESEAVAGSKGERAIYWIPPSLGAATAGVGAAAAPPAALGRVSTFAFNVTASSHVTFANLSFFASAPLVNDTWAGEPSSHLRFESLELNYSTADRRALGDLSPPQGMTVWTTQKHKHTGSGGGSDGGSAAASAGGGAAQGGGHGAAYTNNSYVDVRWRYSNGNVLFHAGSGVVLDNCLANWNDWSTVGGCVPGEYTGSSTLCIDGSSNGAVVRRLTMRYNGRSAGLRPGGDSPPPSLELIHFSDQFQLMGDGCFVEGGGNPAPIIRQCWAHDSGKSALRFDGMYEPPSSNASASGGGGGGTAHGAMLRNVGWNVSAFVVKGDWHVFANNTVFDGADIGPNGARSSLPRYQDAASALNNASVASLAIGAGTTAYDPRADANTRVSSNILDAVGIQRAQCPHKPCSPPGIYDNNLLFNETGVGIRQLLRDPWNWDFRPCPASLAGRLGIGAYASSGGAQFWIPGAMAALASTPVPKDGGAAVKLDAQLMFLQAYRATAHTVLLGLADGSALELVATLPSGANVAVLPRALLPSRQYSWRVDATMANGAVRTGDVWRFATGTQLSCAA